MFQNARWIMAHRAHALVAGAASAVCGSGLGLALSLVSPNSFVRDALLDSSWATIVLVFSFGGVSLAAASAVAIFDAFIATSIVRTRIVFLMVAILLALAGAYLIDEANYELNTISFFAGSASLGAIISQIYFAIRRPDRDAPNPPNERP
ncbi:MAG: hypothetical protein AB7J28_03435 [Hyphomonadaceae bacterium]